MKIAQESFHRLLAVNLFIVHCIGQLDLVFKVQPITFATTEMMDAVAHIPDKG